MRISRSIALAGSVVLASFLLHVPPATAAAPVSFDPNKGTLDGSPLDDLPDDIRLLDIQLPNGGAPMRADWSPDGERLVFLDGPFGDVWQYDLATGATQNLTESFVIHQGVLRAHHLTNGDLVLCGLSERSDDDPEGRIVYRDGQPMIADREVVLDKRDVSPDTPAVEAQDFRSLPDGDADPHDELVFSAYFHKGGQAMGVNLDTGEVTDYAPVSLFYEEAEGVDPAGRYVLVERDLAVTLFPGMVDIWRLRLDGSGAFERVTTFNYYEGFGANNPVVSPDGRYMAFGLKVEGEEGEGRGILLMDLST